MEKPILITKFGMSATIDKATLVEMQRDADLKWFIQWGEEPCPHYKAMPGVLGWLTSLSRRECLKCWAELKKLVEG